MEGGAFLDVGVNLGQTLIKVKCLDPGRRYVGVEPNSACVSHVRKLIGVKGFAETKVIPIALYNRNCLLALDLFSDNEADSSASLIPEFRTGNRIVSSEYVPALTFRTLCDAVAIGRIGIVKIDVEGAELEVVETIEDALIEFRPTVLLEVLPV